MILERKRVDAGIGIFLLSISFAKYVETVTSRSSSHLPTGDSFKLMAHAEYARKKTNQRITKTWSLLLNLILVDECLLGDTHSKKHYLIFHRSATLKKHLQPQCFARRGRHFRLHGNSVFRSSEFDPSKFSGIRSQNIAKSPNNIV